MLTKEQIELAKKDTSHPVVQLMLGMKDYIKEFNKGYEKCSGTDEAKIYRAENFQPLAKKLGQLEDFSMQPLDLVSIWSRVCEDFPKRYEKYDLAGAIPITYATRGINSQKWGKLVSLVMKKRMIPHELLQDDKNQLHFWVRMRDIFESMEEIRFYAHGTREDLGELGRKAYREGDKEVEKRFEKIVVWSKEHKDEILSELRENFGNGFNIFFRYISDEMRKKVFSE